MAARQRRSRLGLLASGALTVGLGMLAGGSAAHAQSLPEPTVPTVPATAVPVPDPSIITVPTTPPTVPPLTVLGPGPAPEPGSDPGDSSAPDGDATSGGSTGPAAGTGGIGPAELPAPATAGDDRLPGGGGADGVAPSSIGPPRDLGTLRRLAVESAGDFSVPFLLGGIAIAYLFFQRRMYADDPSLVAAAREDDELLRFT